MKEFVRNQENKPAQKGNSPRYYGDSSPATGAQKLRGTDKQCSVTLGKIPNKKAKSFK